jgi:hypothetical protein
VAAERRGRACSRDGAFEAVVRRKQTFAAAFEVADDLVVASNE